MTTATLDVLARVDELQLCPATAARIQCLDLENTSMDAIVEVVSTDPVLASRVLGIANTGIDGNGSSVVDLKQAVTRIGLRTTRELAWAISLHGVGAEHALGPSLQRHALRVATATRALSHHALGVTPGDAFVVGLLHDLGSQILLMAEPDEYGALLRQFGVDDPQLGPMEEFLFGIDHAQAAFQCMTDWKLPEHMCRAVDLHHVVRRQPGSRDDPGYALAALIALAEHLVALMEHGFGRDVMLCAVVRDPMNHVLRIPAAAIDHTIETFETEVSAMEEVLGSVAI